MYIQPLSYAHLTSLEASIAPSPGPASNKEVILMQSQMLKTQDKEYFIESQKVEIAGLQKFWWHGYSSNFVISSRGMSFELNLELQKEKIA